MVSPDDILITSIIMDENGIQIYIHVLDMGGSSVLTQQHLLAALEVRHIL